MSARRSIAIAVFSVRTNARAAMTIGGVLLFGIVALLGPLSAWLRDGVWVADEDLIFTGFVVGAVFVLRSGLVDQRVTGLDTFLRGNFVPPLTHMAGMIVSLLTTWAAFCLLALLVVLAATGGDLRAAAWISGVLALRSALLLPFVLVAECVSTLRVPFFLPALLYFVLIILLSILIGVDRTATIMGGVVDRDVPGSAGPLALRAAIVAPTGFLLVLAGTWLRSSLRPSRPEIVAS